jgi:hypothetical protein
MRAIDAPGVWKIARHRSGAAPTRTAANKAAPMENPFKDTTLLRTKRQRLPPMQQSNATIVEPPPHLKHSLFDLDHSMVAKPFESSTRELAEWISKGRPPTPDSKGMDGPHIAKQNQILAGRQRRTHQLIGSSSLPVLPALRVRMPTRPTSADLDERRLRHLAAANPEASERRNAMMVELGNVGRRAIARRRQLRDTLEYAAPSAASAEFVSSYMFHEPGAELRESLAILEEMRNPGGRRRLEMRHAEEVAEATRRFEIEREGDVHKEHRAASTVQSAFLEHLVRNKGTGHRVIA